MDILTTADAVTVLEEGILTPLVQRFMAYDHQFREDAITIKQFGEMGLKANMEEIPQIQMNSATSTAGSGSSRPATPRPLNSRSPWST